MAVVFSLVWSVITPLFDYLYLSRNVERIFDQSWSWPLDEALATQCLSGRQLAAAMLALCWWTLSDRCTVFVLIHCVVCTHTGVVWWLWSLWIGICLSSDSSLIQNTSTYVLYNISLLSAHTHSHGAECSLDLLNQADPLEYILYAVIYSGVRSTLRISSLSLQALGSVYLTRRKKELMLHHWEFAFINLYTVQCTLHTAQKERFWICWTCLGQAAEQ